MLHSKSKPNREVKPQGVNYRESRKSFVSLVIIIAVFIFLNKSSEAQNTFPSSGAAGIGTTTPNSSSLLDVTSTTKGILIPRMTKTQRDAIVSPATGLMIYQTNSTPGFYYYDGAWKAVSPKGVNKSLSNLTTPTAVNVDLLPFEDEAISLGAPALRWSDVYFEALRFPDGTVLSSKNELWTNTGNSGTVDGVNFIGTTDDVPLNFRVNNVKAGRIDGSKSSVFFGLNSGSNNTGQYNVLIGTGAGYSNTSGQYNTAVGNSTLFYNTTGQYNTALGANALTTNSTGSYNTATGSFAMQLNTTGASNTANGYYALHANTFGVSNTAVGYKSLFSNTGGYGNVALGHSALYYGSALSKCVAVGDSALYSNDASGIVGIGYKAGYSNLGSNSIFIGEEAGMNNTTGDSCTFLGYHSGFNNSSGSYNSFCGAKAGSGNNTGYKNSFFGAEAGAANNSGYFNSAFGAYAGRYSDDGNQNSFFGTFAGYSTGLNSSYGSDNSIFGCKAGYYLYSGNDNCIFGSNAGYGASLTDASYNCFFGTTSGYDITSGDYNAFFGYQAGSFNSTGIGNVGVGGYACDGNNTHCTAVGYASAGVGGFTNAMALGYSVYFSGNNQVRIGNNAITSIGGWVNWSNVSDGRVKKNIKENVPGLSFINKLKPITYNLNLDAADKIFHRPARKDQNGNMIPPSDDEVAGRKEKEQIIYTGFIAQDVEEAAQESDYDFSGVDKPQNENGLYGLRYAEFVVPLVKAVQELSAAEEEQKAEDAKQKEEIEKLSASLLEEKSENAELKLRLEKIEAMLQPASGNNSSGEKTNQQTVELDGNAARLDQNIPNPFTQSTVINYFLPSAITEAQINFYDEHGILLKSVSLNEKGMGRIEVHQNDLAAGAYSYQLVVDGKIVDAKLMIITK